jgi:hypothetical protein
LYIFSIFIPKNNGRFLETQALFPIQPSVIFYIFISFSSGNLCA